MKRYLPLLLMITSMSVSAMPPDKKKFSQFTGDLNGDGYTDVVLADRTNYRDLFGFIKVFFGTSRGIDTIPGWTYNCDRSNFLESKFSVSIIGDVNGDGMDELCMLLTNLSNEKSGRSHQDLFLFYGKKDGFGQNPTILKIEQDSKDKVSLRDYFSFDYNGDGFTDILAVSTKRNYKALETGWTDTDRKLLLYRGSDTGINKTFEEIKDVDEIVFKAAGDVNNDGLTDMVIGEPNNKELVWAQFPGSKNHNVTAKAFLSYKLLAPPTSDRIYYATVWDFNGDKYDDALVMREDNSPLLSLKKPDSTSYTLDFYPGSNQGLRDTVTYTWKMKTPPGVVLNITPCGDLNDDGFGDFLLQKFTLKPKEVPLMEAYVLWAEKNGLHLDTRSDFNALFHSIYLVQYGFTSVIALGDVNKDGYADLLLGVETIVYGSKDGNFKSVQLKFLN